MFEAAMYSFVFLWTMAMSPNKEAIKHGLIFVNFMTASMLGSFLAGVLMKRARPETYMKAVFGVATAALAVPMIMSLDTTKNPGGFFLRRPGRFSADTGARLRGLASFQDRGMWAAAALPVAAGRLMPVCTLSALKGWAEQHA